MAEISIIIPVYNKEEYLETCINSISKQSVKDIEIILVDDGSTISCAEACDKFAAADKRIKVIHQANGGPAKARNTGIKIASGKYIMFVDSDDFISENALEGILKEIRKGYPDIVIGNIDYINEINKNIVINNDINDEELINSAGSDAVVGYFKEKTYFWPNTRFIIKNDFFISKNLFFCEDIRSQEDIEWVPRLISSANSFRLYKNKFYKYILRPNSVSNTGNFTKYNDLMKVSCKLWEISFEYEGIRREYIRLGTVLCIKIIMEKYFKFNKKEKALVKKWFLSEQFVTEALKSIKAAHLIMGLFGRWYGILVYVMFASIKGCISGVFKNEK